MRKWLMIIFIHSNCKYNDQSEISCRDIMVRPSTVIETGLIGPKMVWRICFRFEKSLRVCNCPSDLSNQPFNPDDFSFYRPRKSYQSLWKSISKSIFQSGIRGTVFVLYLMRNHNVSYDNLKKMWMLLRRWMSLSNELDNNWIPWSISWIDSK